jgi:glycerol-3-phosphate dehydrogenase
MLCAAQGRRVRDAGQLTSASSARPDYDLIVIGGGINGAGIARDAAMRGLRTCLVEQGDICNGTTRWSSRLIHGGLRYLEHAELGLVYESLHERETLLRIAAHLVRPLKLLIPIYQRSRRGRVIVACGMWLYDLLSFRKTLPWHSMLNAAQAREAVPHLGADGLVGAATYYDAQVVFAERLVVENIIAAQESGAAIRTYSRVDRILTLKNAVSGIRYTDMRTEEQHEISASVVVNAAGPWVDRVLHGIEPPLRKFMGGTKGTHIVVPEFPGATGAACYLEARSDGRPYFVLPWNGMLLIGTTDIRFGGNPSNAHADKREIQYLLDETNRFFPEAHLTRADIHYCYTGVRPLPRRRTKSEGDITRRHVVKHHRKVALGLYSVIGGKLTTYRNLAEEVTDRIFRRLHRSKVQCATADRALPGATRDLQTVDLELSHCDAIDADSRRHLLSVYGCRASLVKALVDRKPALGAAICPHSHAIGAEIVFAVASEMATTLGDILLRRTMIGLSPDQGRAALPAAIRIAREDLEWSDERLDLEERRYLQEIERLRV